MTITARTETMIVIQVLVRFSISWQNFTAGLPRGAGAPPMRRRAAAVVPSLVPRLRIFLPEPRQPATVTILPAACAACAFCIQSQGLLERVRRHGLRTPRNKHPREQ